MKIQYFGAIAILGLLVYGTWKSVKTGNWGKFDKTSMAVWGGLVVLILVVIGFLATIGG